MNYEIIIEGDFYSIRRTYKKLDEAYTFTTLFGAKTWAANIINRRIIDLQNSLSEIIKISAEEI